MVVKFNYRSLVKPFSVLTYTERAEIEKKRLQKEALEKKKQEELEAARLKAKKEAELAEQRRLDAEKRAIQKHKDKIRRIWILVCSILTLILLAIIITNLRKSHLDKKALNELALGDECVGTLNYEEAEKHYLLATEFAQKEYTKLLINNKRTKLDENWNRPVDLGLSVKWGNRNIGAIKPEDYGTYFAWGETSSKYSYSINNYKWYCGDVSYIEYAEGEPYEAKREQYSKYCLDAKFGAIDGRNVLEKKDDAASVFWGEAWRLPTKEEIEELLHNCTWEWTNINGIEGCIVKGKTGNKIFLPASGCCCGDENYSIGKECQYWSSSNEYTDYPCMIDVYIKYGTHELSKSVGNNCRYFGRTIRPVCP